MYGMVLYDVELQSIHVSYVHRQCHLTVAMCSNVASSHVNRNFLNDSKLEKCS
jgi:hypothetical protein